jgi:hypothetical protein
MKAGLEGLVRACAGDDHAHCAILDNLAADSPEAPQHVARFVKPRRRRQAPDDEAPRSARAAPAAGHVDLMAWMQGVHTPRVHS